MTTRYLVNDRLTCLPGTHTFWHDLRDWFGLQFVGGDYEKLAVEASAAIPADATLVVRNATYFGVLETDAPTISLVQDITDSDEQREVIQSSNAAVFNSEYTKSKFNISERLLKEGRLPVIPLPVDFSLFGPGDPAKLQQKLGLPDGMVCWVGACEGAAGNVKGWETFRQVVRLNPDISFAAVFKDRIPDQFPPNLRCYERLSHDHLIDVMGACRVGLCTSKVETQHLAGIEMGACGLPMVAPEVGCYYGREDLPGMLVAEPSVDNYTTAIRGTLAQEYDPGVIHDYWQKEFDVEVIRKQWEELIGAVEHTDSRDS
jgi:glycosyltransferase involved in cell wall biosynthesis